MKRRAGLALIALLLVIMGTQAAKTRRTGRTFQRALRLAVTAPSGTAVDLGAVVPQKWDKLVVFNPYTTAQMVDSVLGFRWRSVSQRTIERDDSHNLLVFISGDRVVYSHMLPRGLGDFCCGYGNTPILRRDAVFLTVRDGTWKHFVWMGAQSGRPQ